MAKLIILIFVSVLILYGCNNDKNSSIESGPNKSVIRTELRIACEDWSNATRVDEMVRIFERFLSNTDLKKYEPGLSGEFLSTLTRAKERGKIINSQGTHRSTASGRKTTCIDTLYGTREINHYFEAKVTL